MHTDDKIISWSANDCILLQKSLIYATLIEKSSDCMRVQLISQESNKATACARVFPNAEFGEKFSNSKMDIMLSRFLGQQIAVAPQKFAECHSDMDKYGNHDVIFKTGKEMHHRHDTIISVISGILHTCKIEHKLELLHINDNTGKDRPAEIWISAWESGEDHAFEIGITSECCASVSQLAYRKAMQ